VCSAGKVSLLYVVIPGSSEYHVLVVFLLCFVKVVSGCTKLVQYLIFNS